ncbi:MAG TPA: hypothetical protein VKT73_12905 [Xanthobacteraceae bacterium]|nr:hypothetical protein [Xanthobacteraceae bacterium]
MKKRTRKQKKPTQPKTPWPVIGMFAAIAVAAATAPTIKHQRNPIPEIVIGGPAQPSPAPERSTVSVTAPRKAAVKRHSASRKCVFGDLPVSPVNGA